MSAAACPVSCDEMRPALEHIFARPSREQVSRRPRRFTVQNEPDAGCFGGGRDACGKPRQFRGAARG
ncbi:MAG: hypothetical protein DMF85_06605 [Acidobacteria bacterium]|nr:MAG: hypothetical protein DMF85_06605 [Acidobacteriota bacterium]